MNQAVVKDKIKKYWLPLAVILTAIIRELMIKSLPIYAIPGAVCDDQLLENWASMILQGNWTGPFNSFIFIKDVGFSIFLAVCYKLHVPYLFGISMLYTFGTIHLVYALRKVVTRKIPWFLLYLLILFHPISYSFSAVQRVYRNGLGMALTLWVFGSILNLYFTILEKETWKPALWAALAGISLGFLWITKSDTIWLMPFVFVVLLVSLVILFVKRRTWSSWIRVGLLLIPFVGIWICTGFVSLMNIRTYGADGLTYYEPAYADMTSTRQEEVNNCSITAKTFIRLCELSPALNSIKEEMLQHIDFYDKYDTTPKDGNLEDGWMGWAFLSAVEHAGYYDDAKTADKFYKDVYEELEAAYASGEIERKDQSKWISYHMDTAEKRRELVDTIGQIFEFVSSCKSITCKASFVTESEMNGVLSFEKLTRNIALYQVSESDYYLNGWILFPGYNLKKLDVYIEDEAGSKFKKIAFGKSNDVKSALPDEECASECRFAVEWDKEDGSTAASYFVCAYDGEEQIAKVSFTAYGFSSDNEDSYLGSVDSYVKLAEESVIFERAHQAVTRMNYVSSVYHTLSPWLVRLGGVSYIFFTLGFLFDLKKKRFEDVDAWLVITGIMLSLLILFFGIAVVHLDQCPAIGVMYLSSGYALLLAAMLVSIYKCVERIVNIINKYKK